MREGVCKGCKVWGKGGRGGEHPPHGRGVSGCMCWSDRVVTMVHHGHRVGEHLPTQLCGAWRVRL